MQGLLGFLKRLGMILLASTVVAIVVSGMFLFSFPDYEVEISHSTGKCAKVLYKGEVLPNGCQMVAGGQIARYDTYIGK